jgi:TP901 family phage tail tape measure protein
MGQTIRRATIVGVAAFAALGVASLMMAADFETAFAEVTTLFDAPKEQVDALRQGVLDLSAEMGVDAIEATQALYQAISAGVAPDNALEFLNQNVRLAVGGVTDLKTAVDLTTTVMNAFGLAEEDLGRINDTLFTTVRLGKTTVDELGQALFNVAPIAAASGASIEEVGAALAVLTAGGTRTSEATTQLRSAIQALTAPTVRQVSRAQALGFTFDETAIATQGLQATINDLMEATGGSQQQLRMLLGSTEAVQAVLRLAGTGADDFTSALLDMDNKAGATQEAFDRMNETFGRQVAILTSQLKVAMIEIGLRVLPLITNAIQVLIPWLRDALPRAATILQQKWEEFRPVVLALSSSFMSGVEVLREFLLPTLQAVADWFANNKPALIAAITAIGLAIVLAFGPVSITIAAILGLIVVIGLVRDNWEMLKDETMRILSVVTDFIDEQMGIWDEVIIGAITAIVGFVRENWDAISSIILGALELIKVNITDQLTFIRDIFRLAFAIFQGDWGRAWDLLKQIVTDRLEFMRQRVEIVLGLIRDTFRLGWAAVRDTVVGALAGIRDVIVFALAAYVNFWTGLPGRIVDALGDLGRLLFDAGKELVQGFIDGINSLLGSIPNPLDFLPDLTPGFDIPGIPGLARGGIVTRPTLALLGEAGPEAVIPLSRGSGASALPAPNITITVHVEDRSPAAIAHAVERAGLELGEQLIAELP